MSSFVDWFSQLFTGFAQMGSWLTTPIWNNWTPLSLIGFWGLSAFLVVAIVKWVL